MLRKINSHNFLFGAIFVYLFLFSCTSTEKKENSENEKTEVKNKVKSYQEPLEIEIKVKTIDPEDLGIFEDGFIPWISLSDPEKDFSNLVGSDEIVVPNTAIDVFIDYPLSEPIEVRVETKNPEGFTLKELISGISREYIRIYKEEEESASQKTIPAEERDGVVNRNSTNGKYGICCHDLSDLDLSGFIIYFESEIPSIELYIES